MPRRLCQQDSLILFKALLPISWDIGDVIKNISQQYFENKFRLLFVTIQASLSCHSSKDGLRMLL